MGGAAWAPPFFRKIDRKCSLSPLIAPNQALHLSGKNFSGCRCQTTTILSDGLSVRLAIANRATAENCLRR